MKTASTSKAAATQQEILKTGLDLVLRKGFTALGLQEILQTSGIPKGSFYYYFSSKEAFGCAVIEAYSRDYVTCFDRIFADGSGNARERLMHYWRSWIHDNSAGAAHETGLADRCLVVKLAAEVADLSDDMRLRLRDGTNSLTDRIASAITLARADRTLASGAEAGGLARVLLELWLGAALLAKLDRSRTPLEYALQATAAMLPPPDAGLAVPGPCPAATHMPRPDTR